MAVGRDGIIVHSGDGDRWESARDTATTRQLSGVTWSGDRFVAVGVRGAIVHSRDGDLWEPADDSHAWYDAGRIVLGVGLTWSGTRFVAVGAFSPLGTTAPSSHRRCCWE